MKPLRADPDLRLRRDLAGPGRTDPAWRRVGRRARDVVYRAATFVERMTDRGAYPLMPPAHLRKYYYRTLKRQAFSHAAEGAAAELVSRGLRPEHRLPDIGSGIGNLAVGLIGYLQGSYDGVEVQPEAVAWCQRAITPRHPRFRFHHADLFSRVYNPQRRTVAAGYRFPFDDRQFDVVFLGSVFTHLLPDAVERYVHEISRVLAPGGICVASYFLLNPDSRAGIDAGRSFMSLPVDPAFQPCRLHDARIPEAAVALDEEWVRKIHADAGLQIRDIRSGGWWSGAADDQDVLMAKKHLTQRRPRPQAVGAFEPAVGRCRIAFTGMLCACALLAGLPAFAQSRRPGPAPVPAVSVGAGVGTSTNDAASRMRLTREATIAVRLLEATAAVSTRIGIGVEYSQPSAASASTTVGVGRTTIAGRQDERVLLGLVRARLAGTGRLSLDALGGAGVLFQHHESWSCTPASERCAAVKGGSVIVDARAPAMTWGIEVPIVVAHHVEIVPGVRAYSLRRGEHISRSGIYFDWQNEWRSSARGALLVTGRLVW